jgi:hypothetical protein
MDPLLMDYHYYYYCHADYGGVIEGAEFSLSSNYIQFMEETAKQQIVTERFGKEYSMIFIYICYLVSCLIRLRVSKPT